jgi:hypothetical protein
MMAVLLVLEGVVVPPASAIERIKGETAVFEGREINLADDWGEATACLIWNDAGVVECFRTEEVLDARVAQIEQGLGLDVGSESGRSSWCSGYIRLYDGTNYTGSLLYLRDRVQWLNLSGYGFSDRTSSFTISACAAYFADDDWGGGSWYPTSGTEAWDVAPFMASGWNNRVSSVYIK